MTAPGPGAPGGAPPLLIHDLSEVATPEGSRPLRGAEQLSLIHI